MLTGLRATEDFRGRVAETAIERDADGLEADDLGFCPSLRQSGLV
jgi:hypothetical protein